MRRRLNVTVIMHVQLYSLSNHVNDFERELVVFLRQVKEQMKLCDLWTESNVLAF